MLFCKYPQAFFPQLCITAVVLPGNEYGETGESGERIIDNRRIEGSIPEMLDQAITFIRKNMKIKTIVDPDTGKREDQTEYPVTAIREAVLNALVHRDYSMYTEGRRDLLTKHTRQSYNKKRKSIMNNSISKFYDLKNLEACMDDFRYVYSPFSKTHYKFRQDKDYVSNFRNDEATKNSADGVEVPDYFYGVNPDEYAWIGLFSKEKYTAGTKVTLHSFYDHFGGPLVSFGDNYTTDENGHNIYGLYFEVVPWQDGCNYWEVKPSREKKEWSIDPVLLAEPKFPIEDGEMVETVVEFGEKEIHTTINGHKYDLKIDHMPESFHVGFACCEAGIGHFLDFRIEK